MLWRGARGVPTSLVEDSVRSAYMSSTLIDEIIRPLLPLRFHFSTSYTVRDRSPLVV